MTTASPAPGPAEPVAAEATLFERLKRAAHVVLDAAPAVIAAMRGGMSEHVQLDLEGRRFQLSHPVLASVLAHASARTGQFEVEAIDGGQRGLQVRGRASAHRIAVLLVPHRIEWRAGTMTVHLATPEGFVLVGRPIVTLFIRVFMRVFGRSSLGARVVARTTPPELRWDGRRATWTTEVVEHGAVHRWLEDATGVVVTTALDDHGVWFTVEGGAVASVVEVVGAVTQLIATTLASGPPPPATTAAP